MPIAAAQTDFSALDDHALHVPSRVCASIGSLAEYLAKPAQSDLEKARSIFRWVTANIEYDHAAYFGKSPHSDGSPETTLRRRMGVCAGYSSLYQALAGAAGIKVATIAGHGKGHGYEPGDEDLATNHEWNSVLIDGAWQLLDSTWGAGYIGKGNGFTKEFDGFWFLTPPPFFIFSHFPEKERWQLLPRPVSRDIYVRAPFMRSGYFHLGVQLADHARAVLEADSDLRISMTSKADLLMSSRLEGDFRRQALPLSFCQEESGRHVIRATFPSAGEYKLSIFAKRKIESGSYPAILEYKIRAIRGAVNRAGYPEALQGFKNAGAELFEPFSGYLKRGKSYTFKARVPGAREVAVVSGDEWTALSPKNGNFEREAFIKAGETGLYGRFQDGKKFEGLLRYETF